MQYEGDTRFERGFIQLLTFLNIPAYFTKAFSDGCVVFVLCHAVHVCGCLLLWRVLVYTGAGAVLLCLLCALCEIISTLVVIRARVTGVYALPAATLQCMNVAAL